MAVPADRRYAETHEWHMKDGDLVVVGLTQFAVDQLTDITFAEMQGEGTTVEAGGEIGEVESVKTSSDIYSGVSGEIVQVNGALADDPSVLNTDPFGEGWLVKIRPSNPDELEGLMDAVTYDEKNPS